MDTRRPLSPWLGNSQVHRPEVLWRRLLPLWPFWLALGTACLAALLGLAVGLERLGHRWAFAYKHGYLLVAMSAWLLLRSAPAGSVAWIGPSALGFALLIAGTSVYILAELLDFTLALQLMLPALLFAAIAAIGGWQVAGVAAIPVGLIYFAVPVWDLLIPPLQYVSTAVVTGVLSLGDIPVYVDGYLIHIAAGTFEIAEGCSGHRYFMVALALAAFYGCSWYRRWSSRLLLLAAAGFGALASNWIRIYLLILIGESTDMQHFLIAEHDEFGWVVFFLTMGPVVWFARWLEVRETAAEPAVTRDGVAPRLASVPLFLGAGTLAALVLASPAALRAGTPAPDEPQRIELEHAANEVWTATAGQSAWKPVYVRPHQEGHGSFIEAGGAVVDVYVVRYLNQQAESKLIWNQNDLSGDWQQTASRVVTARVGSETRRLREVELVRSGERRLVWYWYSIGGASSHDRIRAKLLEVPALLLRGRRDGALVGVSAVCELDCRGTRDGLQRFLADVGAEFDRLAVGPAGREDAEDLGQRHGTVSGSVTGVGLANAGGVLRSSALHATGDSR